MSSERQKASWLGSISDLLMFALRCAILSVIFAGTLAAIAAAFFGSPKVRHAFEKVQAELRVEKNRLRIAGLLTTNPQVHYRISLIHEKDGKLARAIDEIDLAVGLLELHKADKAVIDRYTRRLEELKRKQATESPKKTGG